MDKTESCHLKLFIKSFRTKKKLWDGMRCKISKTSILVLIGTVIFCDFCAYCFSYAVLYLLITPFASWCTLYTMNHLQKDWVKVIWFDYAVAGQASSLNWSYKSKSGQSSNISIWNYVNENFVEVCTDPLNRHPPRPHTLLTRAHPTRTVSFPNLHQSLCIWKLLKTHAKCFITGSNLFSGSFQIKKKPLKNTVEQGLQNFLWMLVAHTCKFCQTAFI